MYPFDELIKSSLSAQINSGKHTEISNCKRLLFLIDNNTNYFNQEDISYSPKYVDLFMELREYIVNIGKHIETLSSVVHLYDLDEETPGNGYRSFLKILDVYLQSTMKLCKKIASSRDSLLFRADHNFLELKAHVRVIGSLTEEMLFLIKMISRSKKGELFSINDQLSAEELLKEYGNIDQLGFYGRCNGFYYYPSMRKALQGVNVIMASFSNLYQQPGGALSHAASSLLSGGKYVLDPELRAEQIVCVAQNASVEFIKAFWGLTDSQLVKQVPSWVCSNVAVAETVIVPGSPVTVLKAGGGGEVTVPGTSSDVRCRLLSYTRREGQPGAKAGAKVAEPSAGLIIHCHGGGFVSQSPDSHEIYLREWAKETDVPILSIDYSLAPEAPFPQPLDEIVLAYAWALNNLPLLGSTGDQICVAGDSAGGNLSLAMVLKCQALGIRPPDGAVIMYAPLLLDMVPSPSRLMSMMDPLIPLGFMLTCLDAYAGLNQIDQDEYSNESPLKEERLRKTSTISEYIESNMILLKDINIIAGDNDDDAGFDTPDSEESFVVLPPGEEEIPQSSTHKKEDSPLSSTPPSPKGVLKLRQSGSLPDSLPSSGSASPDSQPTDYVEQFLKKYNSLDRRVAKSQGCNDQLSLFDLPADLTYNLHRKCCQWSRACLDRVSNMVLDSRRLIRQRSVPSVVSALPWYKPPEHHLALSDKFKKMKILASNPFMSPFYATDEQLRQLPPLYILSLDFDPCLDDSVMLARRLKRLNKPVQLNILTGLPHGFLNFAFFIKEANDGSKLCINMIRAALGLKALVKF